MRQRNLISWDGGFVEILDWDALAEAGEFDDLYLHLVQERR